MMAPPPDSVSIGPGQNFYYVVQAPRFGSLTLPKVDAGEEFLRGRRAVVSLARREAIVAGAAVLLPNCSPKYPSSRAAAAGALGVNNHLLQLRAGDLLLPPVWLLVDEVVCLTASPAVKSSTHSLGNPSRPARPVSW